MNPRKAVARDLVTVLSSGAWTRAALEERARTVLGSGARKSTRTLVDELIERAGTPYAPPPDRLACLILDSRTFDRAAIRARRLAGSHGPVLSSPKFWAVPSFRDLPAPRLTTTKDLAGWLGLTLAELEWLSDARRQHGRTEKARLQNYTYAWIPKRSGDLRLVEAPKSRLKAAQRRILRKMLGAIPVHDAAHGFVRGRSCLSAAQRHGGERLVIGYDLRNFFLTVPARRVHGLYRCIGYPWAVARALAGLCTTTTPTSVIAAAPTGWRDRDPCRVMHLAQGAPTSPALANLCAHRLDCRLRGLAGRLSAQYTRYADDLAFSGGRELEDGIGPFRRAVAAIAEDEGFALNEAKTRIMRRHNRQQVTGLVVNDHLNVPRDAYDRLKAILHNCRRHGPAGQNRDDHADFRAHLDGRVTWVETVNRRRGLKLRQVFESIDW